MTDYNTFEITITGLSESKVVEQFDKLFHKIVTDLDMHIEGIKKLRTTVKRKDPRFFDNTVSRKQIHSIEFNLSRYCSRCRKTETVVEHIRIIVTYDGRAKSRLLQHRHRNF